MELSDFNKKISESALKISDEQACFIFDALSQNGYTISGKDADIFVLSWIDQSGEMEKEVSAEQIITLVANLKYREVVEIMNQLDDIITINMKNLPIYCENLSNLIKKEKELHLAENILVQTEYFNHLKSYVATNIGNVPVEDYREMVAMQNGFDSYDEMYQKGFRIGNGYDKETEPQNIPEKSKKVSR